MNNRQIHGSMHGYLPPLPVYRTHFDGQPAPPGYAFNQDGEVVLLPYEPWSFEPQMAWEDPQNTNYVDYAAGRMSIEHQPSADPRLPPRYGKQDSTGHVAPATHQDFALVPQSAYLQQDGDLVPAQNEGTTSEAILDSPASMARTRYKLAKEILGIVQVSAPTTGSPLLDIPTGDATSAPPVPPFGGAVALGVAQFGHLGTSTSLVFDVLPGSVVKVPTVGTIVKLTGREAPRYFASVDTGVEPNIIREYLLFPGGPVLTNDSFSDLPPNVMQLNGFVNANPIIFSGWAGHGLSTTPSIQSLPSRIFRGSVLSSAVAPAAFTNRSRIPIPHGATSVAIIGGFYDPTHVPTTIGIEWTQNLDVIGSVLGPFPSDSTTPVPIAQGATSIDVFGGNGAAAGDTDIPFFAIFYLNI